ncbi:hypothetical protein A2662_03225 [Candidatus Giovannonibacteria bacterium RIFCSPHIGHO2_01_FULL_45_33]|uniref:Uncharacterized protein n=1 Tax=Candidatus Giovannonibacteria bacterium RIFCSPLOWO2_01_FULL_45_34 TaxID=1798351 RepID=A0A1F5WZK2_9BACT|nr:MAG: hypothetical protein A2662_03225 [Candidatus Giovannonibacteria bacterium RIFCSPHIGHO2_01_FULL_45_33]OGF69525.1 MAG: hypothetical protein A3C73_04960 [Candidatus Giovannonibacteria bacterium RIFCSPHIGHO2_02_FULL_44_11]OGF81085.1 MAG: hypothetical protein A2930_00750 [Candidatus Giovannonibacteria bacterium RIFCSPLOWO2_01_FULL_45_34]
MQNDWEFYAKKQYVLNLGQLERIEFLVCKTEWSELLNKEDIRMFAINLVIAEDIADKFYPEEADERLQKRLLKDLADFLDVIRKDAEKLYESENLMMLQERIKVLQTFLENPRQKSAA